MGFQVQQRIKCPPATAFDLMADARNEVRWNAQVSRSELVSGEPIGSGSTFVTVNRGREYNATITTYDRPDRLGFEVTGEPMDITGTFTFAAVDGGTDFIGAFDFRPKGRMKLLFPLLRPVISRDLEKQSASFKDLCEASAQSSA